ncbi:TIGR04149 family rSAM-modified RiPP [Tenacibaculum xiamenense]|uniref:TIGR04149 family rSAM-modified RiPP n=1 Tax=Tenacibaculum xiamenense TaxID=1261553 RepID=UPI0038961FD0
MEKLSLEKFSDVKLESKKMTFVKGGDCTGGGFSRCTNKRGNVYFLTWESDDTNGELAGVRVVWA